MRALALSNLRVVFLTLVLATPACDPTPTFGPPAPDVPGKIYAERTAVTTADGAVVVLDEVTVTFPPTALPAGTTVTVRVLVDVHKTLNGVEPASMLHIWGHPAAAVQIAPETLRFADTAGIEIRTWVSSEAKSVDLLFATADEPAWEQLGPATVFEGQYRAILAVTRGGTWSLVYDAGGRDAGRE